MTRDDMAEIMEQMCKEERDTREAGQREYAHEIDNAFANFERIGKELGISREKVLLIFARKHWDGVVAWANGHRSQRENVRGRIKDLRVYLSLLRGMVEDSEKENRSDHDCIGTTQISANLFWPPTTIATGFSYRPEGGIVQATDFSWESEFHSDRDPGDEDDHE